MKKIILSALILVLALCSVAIAAPSVTMLSTKSCPACAQMSKVLNELDANYKGKITTSRVYLEDNVDVAKKYNVRYVPTLIFKDSNGKEIAREVGYKSASEVIQVFAKKGIKI